MIPILARSAFALAVSWALATVPAAAAPAAADPAAAASAAAASPAAAEPSPALWLLADEDTKIYLFGTVHILPPDLAWRSPAIDRVIEEADELVMELTETDVRESMTSLQGQVMLGKQVPLIERVSPERRPKLRQILSAAGMPAEMFDGLQTWVAAIFLSMTPSMEAWSETGKAGQPPMSGVEEVLDAEFVRRERPISAVETAQMQLGFFSGLPLSVQRSLLEQTIDALAEGNAPADPDESDWVSGDVEAIGAEMEVLPPELFAVLLTQRNRSWTQWLVDRLERPGTVLFAVGAGHLAGRDSVQSMLEARGLTVTRLD